MKQKLSGPTEAHGPFIYLKCGGVFLGGGGGGNVFLSFYAISNISINKYFVLF